MLFRSSSTSFFFHRTDNSKIKNASTYYYPNNKFEGYGLKVHCREIGNRHYCSEDIFGPESNWVIAYTNLNKNIISYKIENIQRETFYDNQNRRYSLLFQCKINRNKIRDVQNFNITLVDENEDILNDYVIPYRLLKEYID